MKCYTYWPPLFSGCFSELILPVPWTLMLLIDLRVREWEMAIIKATLSDDILVPRQERTIEAIQVRN